MRERNKVDCGREERETKGKLRVADVGMSDT